MNKNVESIENKDKKSPLPEMEEVEEKIVLREDDNEELDYSMTGSFNIVKKKEKE